MKTNSGMMQRNNILLSLTTPLLGLISLLFLGACQSKTDSSSKESSSTASGKEYAIAIHGGAGTISRDISDSTRQAYRNALDSALTIGENVLKNGGDALDAVEQVVRDLEDNPMFNAGKGAVYTSKGEHELDAAIMNGNTLEAGAITGIKTVKNPISLARIVMQRSRHILFSGDGAEAFADQTDVERVKNSYFDTEHRYEDWREYEEEESGNSSSLENHTPESEEGGPSRFGTVGCVALDKNGNLAAGTSTGGLTGKEFGRVGDVPIVGAGTYANDRAAVSATGNGEDIMRHVTGFHVASYMEYEETSLEKAATYLIDQVFEPGKAGLISVDHKGNIAMPFNTQGMYRGAADSEGKHFVKIWD